MRIVIIGMAMLWLAAIGCSGDSLAYRDVDDAVSRLSDNVLSDEVELDYELIGAYDGRQFRVEPGDYTVEMYVFKDLERLADEASIRETDDNQVHIEGNMLLLLDTSYKLSLFRLLSDLRD